MSKLHFTQRTLEKLPAPRGDHYAVYRDAVARGLGLKIEPSGHRTYFWSRKARGKLEWKTIGEFESVTLEDARGKASEFNSSLARWKQDDAPGDNPFARPKALTLGDVVAAYTARHIRHTSKRPDRAAKDIQWQVDNYLAALRNRRVMTVRRDEILKLREAIHEKHGVYAANRLLQMLRAALNWSIGEAELWRGPNPATGISLFKEVKRQRFLLAPELAAIWRALQDKKTVVDLRHFVLLALMTGARKNDVLSSRWSDLALDRATWLVPNPKNQEPYTIALTAEVVKILKERQARAQQLQAKTGMTVPWVFPSDSATGHVLDMKRAWKGLLRRAKINNLRQHDLRRTLGSWQAAGGASLSIIGKSLGHRSVGSTQVYAQLQLDPIRASVQAATRAMLAAKAPVEKPKLLPARQKKARHA